MRTDIVSSLGVPVFIFIFLCSVINAIEIDEVLENIQKKENYYIRTLRDYTPNFVRV